MDDQESAVQAVDELWLLSDTLMIAGITTPQTSLRVSSAKSTTAGVASFFNMVVADSINAWMAGFLDLFATAKDWAAPRVVAKKASAC